MPKSKPNDADVLMAAWNGPLVFDRTKRNAMNQNPLDITIDQLRQLYVLLYPMIEQDFKHRDDLFNYIKALKQEFEVFRISTNTKLAQQGAELVSHIHTGNLGAPTSPAITSISTVVLDPLGTLTPEDTPFTIAGSSHLKVRVAGTITYIQRNSIKNTNVKANILGKSIEQMLFKDAKVFIPFDVGESDSALDSSATFVDNKTIIDL